MTGDLATDDAVDGRISADRRRPGRASVDPQLIPLLRETAAEIKQPLLHADEWQILPISPAQMRRERILMRALQGMAVAWALTLAASILWMSPGERSDLGVPGGPDGPAWSHP